MDRQKVAKIINMSAANFDQRIRPLLQKSDIKGKRATLRFNVIAVVAVVMEYRQADGEHDLDLDDGQGVPSDALERYRHERYIEARRNNAIAEGKLIDRETIVQAMTAGTTVMRNTALQFERLTQLSGREAREIYDEGVTAFEQAAIAALKAAAEFADARDATKPTPAPSPPGGTPADRQASTIQTASGPTCEQEDSMAGLA